MKFAAGSLSIALALLACGFTFALAETGSELNPILDTLFTEWLKKQQAAAQPSEPITTETPPQVVVPVESETVPLAPVQSPLTDPLSQLYPNPFLPYPYPNPYMDPALNPFNPFFPSYMSPFGPFPLKIKKKKV